jgi:glycosyltransferase involved in cell wall biosynthesis
MVQIASPRPAVLFVALQTGSKANGGIASLDQVVRSMRRHRPIILTNLETSVTEAWRSAGFAVELAPEAASAGIGRVPVAAIRSYFYYTRRVLTLIKRHRISVVHANDPLAFQLSLPAVRLADARIVLNIRDTFDPARSPARTKYRLLFSQADKILFLSKDMINRWSDIAPNAPSRATATYSVVDFDHFARCPFPDAEEAHEVLVSGVMSEKKGQLFFLQEVAPLLARAGIRSILAGDFNPLVNEYAERCRVAAIPLGDAVEFVGYHTDIAPLIQRSRVVCVTSRYEGLMRTMIEAMAVGRPVVSTDVASAREMLTIPGEEAGIVFSPDEAGKMAEGIIRLCRNDAEARRMGSNGAAIARRRFKRDDVVRVYEDCYEALGGEAQDAGRL